jgi:hypothetical protein
MNEISNENVKKLKNKSRWRRDEMGVLHYRGICPFNNGMCSLANLLSRTRKGSR